MNLKRGQGIRLHIDELTASPGPYVMSFGFNLEVLCESIRKVGLINPPLVARNQQGTFEIVSGYRRILALKALGEGESFCLDLTSTLASPMERFLTGLYENLSTRKFNEIEKAMILHRLQDYVSKEEIVGSFMPLLCLPSHEGTLKFYLNLLGLEENIQKAVAREEISMSTVKALIEMGNGDRQCVFRWVSTLGFNFNQGTKLIELIKDISMREKKGVHEMLSEAPFVEIAENPRLNMPQKAKAVLETLRTRRFPRLKKAQQAVLKKVSAIPLPPDTSVHYDPNLEDPYYHLDIRFKHGKDLMKAIRRLHALHEVEAIPELWAGP